MSQPPPIQREQPDTNNENEKEKEKENPPTLDYQQRGTTRPRDAMDLITVATFADSWEANLALGKLQDAGIPAVLADENIIATGGGLYTNMAGGVKLRVPNIDAERALAALPKRVRSTIVKCPKCGATDTRQIDFSPGVKILFLLLLGIPYLFVQKPWTCLTCGHAWNPPPQSQVEDDEDDEDDDDEDMATDDRRMNTDEKPV